MISTTAKRRGAVLLVAGATALLWSPAAAPASAESTVDRPAEFTSAFTTNAVPGNVIDPDGNPAPGEEGATGTFNFMINSTEEIICYDITLRGVTPPYESMAKTATHVHETVEGENGPPRLAFPDPTGEGDVLTSSGCLQGPFTSGLEGDDGADTGEGFSLKQIEADPAGFSADTHTSSFVPGAVRGQLQEMPVGGVETGRGGSATAVEGTAGPLALTIAGLGMALVAATAVRRRARG